ncbi:MULTISPECIES: hypothetical protein [Niastella]|uniref:Lipid/polyisoprenoid-binding YceI-like domain-containing protein n=1 Tax=Niastella soli TaxID=2821487 RepID=A0ABS3YWN4_9BACT|nr:hypothetical protein [Niastella soli]MBO9201912.1 hypothetical protein [Niastella soli]
MQLLHLIPLLCFFSTWHTGDTSVHRTEIKWVIQKTSRLNIAGHTNVNNFACGVDQYTRTDTITFMYDPTSSCIKLRGALLIDINLIDCRNKPMTCELKRTLKQPQYPFLKIAFLTLEKIAGQMGNDNMKGCVNIEMAGVCKRFEINYAALVKNEACMELIGCQTFRFSDFGLEPPRKMGGIIRVKNELDVQFHLYIQQIKS